MTEQEFTRRAAAIRTAARQRVPEWEPWMTAKVGYAGNGVTWLRHPERHGSSDEPRLSKRERDRARYLRRMADPVAYERFLAKARADQAVRDARERETRNADA